MDCADISEGGFMKQLGFILCLLFLSVSSFAGNSPACSPAGTWYGGGDYKYILTITPVTGQRFAMRGEGAFDNTTLGYRGWTSFSSQFFKLKDGRYVGYGLEMFTTSSELPPPLSSLELDGIRAWMEFIDCDNIRFTYDFFGAYFDLNKVPFVDQPDVNYLPPGGITETYSRMPTRCPVCEAPQKPSVAGRNRH